MSLRAIVKVVVHFESFRNIDLCKQGHYYIQVQVFHRVQDKLFSAYPHNLLYKDREFPQKYAKIPGELDDIYYKSQIFTIKYCDEDFDINEIAVFRTEICEIPYSELPELCIQCDLMYSASASPLGSTYAKSFSDIVPAFTIEATTEVRIRNSLQGLNQFMPITFDDTHCCVINSTLHIIPIDFRFRPRPMLTSLEETSLSPLKSQDSSEFNVANTLSELLFPGQSLVDAISILQMQNKYVKLLHTVYNKNLKLVKDWGGIWAGLRIDDRKKERGAEENEVQIMRVPESEASVAAEMIHAQIQSIAEQLNLLEFELIERLRRSPTEICYLLMLKYNDMMKDRWGESIFRTAVHLEDFCVHGSEKTSKNHKKVAKRVRRSEYYQNMDKPSIYMNNYFPLPDFHPILFLDISSKVPEDRLLWQPEWVSYMNTNDKSVHLIVLVHGFQGNSFDLRLIRNHIASCRSNAYLMCSSKNEEHTEGDIATMGERLAREVERFIRDWCPRGSIDKISFVGHSLGGIIIRAALPYLQDLSPKFHFLMTFSTPHIGYMYNSSVLVDAGMWIIKKWKKSLCMKQLSMTDYDNVYDCFLYGLSKRPGIEWFKHIALISSVQDNYAPFESARIDVGPSALEDSKGRIYVEMANNILRRVNAEKIHRIDVDFSLEKKGIDSMIGRAAHIQMLESRTLINMILHCCASFFGNEDIANKVGD